MYAHLFILISFEFNSSLLLDNYLILDLHLLGFGNFLFLLHGHLPPVFRELSKSKHDILLAKHLAEVRAEAHASYLVHMLRPFLLMR